MHCACVQIYNKNCLIVHCLKDIYSLKLNYYDSVLYNESLLFVGGKKMSQLTSKKEPAGKRRIKDAFWQLYQERPIEDIGIKEIVALAGCNRTTFYYHYKNIHELLDDIEQECIIQEVPYLVVDVIHNNKNHVALLELISAKKDVLERISLLLGPNGDPAFAQKLKDVIFARWRELICEPGEDLPREKQIILEYLISGMLGLVSNISSGAHFTVEEIAGVMMRLYSAGLLKSIDSILFNEN